MKTSKKKREFKHRNGYIATELKDECLYEVAGCKIPLWMIEDSKGDWEEIIEKDYDILKFVRHSLDEVEITSIKRLPDGLIVSVGDKDRHGDVVQSLDKRESGILVYLGKRWGVPLSDFEPAIEKDYEILEYRIPELTPVPQKEIHKVKRLSDGAIIKVGDRDLHDYEVVSIKERDNKIHVEVCSDIGNVAFPLLKYYEPKPTHTPILTSEDGVVLYEGDKCYINSSSVLSEAQEYTIDSTEEPHEDILYFSTRFAAEEYRLNNARVLSIDDIKKECCLHPSTRMIKNIERLVKSRLT